MLDLSTEDALISDFVDRIMDYLCDPALQEDFADQISEICNVEVADVFRSGGIFLDLACAKLVMENHLLSSDGYTSLDSTITEEDRRMLADHSRRLFGVLCLELRNHDQAPMNLRNLLRNISQSQIENTLELFKVRLETQGAPKLCELILQRFCAELRLARSINRDAGLYLSIVIVGMPFSRFWADATDKLSGKNSPLTMESLLTP
jgi:hypothetical protein